MAVSNSYVNLSSEPHNNCPVSANPRPQSSLSLWPRFHVLSRTNLGDLCLYHKVKSVPERKADHIGGVSGWLIKRGRQLETHSHDGFRCNALDVLHVEAVAGQDLSEGEEHVDSRRRSRIETVKLTRVRSSSAFPIRCLYCTANLAWVWRLAEASDELISRPFLQCR